MYYAAMTKQSLATLALTALFLVPSFSYAATLEETRHTLLMQLISLIEQEIVTLQAQLAAQEANVPLGAVLSPTATTTSTVTDQIATITQQLGTTMPEEVPFELFTGEVQDGYVGVVANHPIASILGENVASYETITNGDTHYRATRNPAYTYNVLLKNSDKGYAFTLDITDTTGTAITRSLSR